MAKKKILFIVNPISGTGSKLSVYRDIRRYVSAEKFDISICHTKYAGHASKLAHQAVKEGVDIVAAVGGDGTVNEVARALVRTEIALGIVPCGSGNGLARHLHIPMNTVRALSIINEAEICDLDHGVIDGRPFFCTCGTGFDAFVSMKFAAGGKRGPKTYLENVLKGWLKYKPEVYTIENEDGTLQMRAFLIACANASQYGNNAYIAPHASMEDGLMDVILMEPFNALEAPVIAAQLFTKQLPGNSHIKTFRARKIIIHRSEDGIAHCDGDPIETKKDITVEMMPHSFKVVVNASDDTMGVRNLMQWISDDITHWWERNIKR